MNSYKKAENTVKNLEAKGHNPTSWKGTLEAIIGLSERGSDHTFVSEENIEIIQELAKEEEKRNH